MKLSRVVFVALIAVFAGCLAQAQQPESVPRQNSIPQGIEALRQNATSKTEFTLDHSMLVFVSRLDKDKDNDDLRRVIAGVDGLSVHSYHFPRPGMYDPEALSSVKKEHHAAGWTQLVNKHSKDGGPGVTDLWVRYENNAISKVAILVARADNVNLIELSGSISPLELSHLGGHFGIPKVEGGVLVPSAER